MLSEFLQRCCRDKFFPIGKRWPILRPQTETHIRRFVDKTVDWNTDQHCCLPPSTSSVCSVFPKHHAVVHQQATHWNTPFKNFALSQHIRVDGLGRNKPDNCWKRFITAGSLGTRLAQIGSAGNAYMITSSDPGDKSELVEQLSRVSGVCEVIVFPADQI